MRPKRVSKSRDAQVARREVELLVVERIVGDVHLPVEAQKRAAGVDHRRGVVVHARAAPLEHGANDRHVQFACQARQRFRGRAGHRFGQGEQLRVLLAAEVLRAEQLLEADDLRPAAGGLADAPLGLGQILRRGRARTTSAPGPRGRLGALSDGIVKIVPQPERRRYSILLL